MRTKSSTIVLSLALCGSALAWNFDLATLGLTQKDLETRVRNVLRDATPEVQVPWLAPNFKQVAKGLSEPDRATAVQAAAAAVKSLVTSDAFQKTFNESLKNSFQAVDHGLKVYSQEEMLQMAINPKPGVDPMGDMHKQLMAKGALEHFHR